MQIAREQLVQVIKQLRGRWEEVLKQEHPLLTIAFGVKRKWFNDLIRRKSVLSSVKGSNGRDLESLTPSDSQSVDDLISFLQPHRDKKRVVQFGTDGYHEYADITMTIKGFVTETDFEYLYRLKKILEKLDNHPAEIDSRIKYLEDEIKALKQQKKC